MRTCYSPPVKRLALSVGSFLVIALGCSSERAQPVPAPSPELTAQEVQQLFLEWACPANPAYAERVYQPNVTWRTDDPDAWLVDTTRGEFTVDDSARVLAPSADVSTATLVLREGEHCATTASRRP